MASLFTIVGLSHKYDRHADHEIKDAALYVLDKVAGFLNILCGLFEITPESIAASKGITMPKRTHH